MEQSFYNYAALDNLTNNIDNIPLDNIVIKISSYEIKNKDEGDSRKVGELMEKSVASLKNIK